MEYDRYLQLDRVLDAQRPLTGQHDEMMFIVIHQTTELWFKCALHELDAAIAHIRADRLQAAAKILARVSRIQSQLIQSWDVLSTLTPADYLTFRSALGSASGLQSVQYRLLEFRLGAKDATHARRADEPTQRARLDAAMAEPSLYDEAILALGRQVPMDGAAGPRDWRVPHAADPAVTRAWMVVYRDTERYWDLYELAEKLVDLADWYQQWRFRHLTTVARIIGFKPGTGGTAGVAYLKRALEHRFFPELWDVRTAL
ncbi:MAG: tryptophan 2,3-dioxygenase family protein [Alphaproteobacteria bacterium]